MTVPAGKIYTYLALGDSYTIGEMVAPDNNFPNQVYQLLQKKAVNAAPPRIIARTGWTTDELETAIREAEEDTPLSNAFDLVSLLIGVNDQYRGRPVEQYGPAFEALLKKAIHYSGNRPDRVVVLSIPDWGVTPFANGAERARIASEIDAYNEVNKSIAGTHKVHYIDITPWTRESAGDPGLLTTDGLHPSAREYQRWAAAIVAVLK